MIFTGLTPEEEAGFFCYMDDAQDAIQHGTQCDLMRKALAIWEGFSDSKRKPYAAKSKACKEKYSEAFLTDSCFRAMDREIAQENTNKALLKLYKDKANSKVKVCFFRGICRHPPPDVHLVSLLSLAYPSLSACFNAYIWCHCMTMHLAAHSRRSAAAFVRRRRTSLVCTS